MTETTSFSSIGSDYVKENTFLDHMRPPARRASSMILDKEFEFRFDGIYLAGKKIDALYRCYPNEDDTYILRKRDGSIHVIQDISTDAITCHVFVVVFRNGSRRALQMAVLKNDRSLERISGIGDCPTDGDGVHLIHF